MISCLAEWQQDGNRMLLSDMSAAGSSSPAALCGDESRGMRHRHKPRDKDVHFFTIQLSQNPSKTSITSCQEQLAAKRSLDVLHRRVSTACADGFSGVVALFVCGDTVVRLRCTITATKPQRGLTSSGTLCAVVTSLICFFFFFSFSKNDRLHSDESDTRLQ